MGPVELALGAGHERDAGEADRRADPDPRRPRLAARAQAVEEQEPEGHGGHDEGGDPARHRLLRPHHERVPDGEEQDADERVVEPLAARRPAVAAVDDEGDEAHDHARAQEARARGGERRHLAHDDAHREVGRAPHDPDDEERDPGQQRRRGGSVAGATSLRRAGASAP